VSAAHEPGPREPAPREDEARVDAWRELYERLEPPPLADEADAGDAESARAVAWMRAAWRNLDVPVASAPPLHGRHTPAPSARRSWNLHRLAPLALAAAALLAALALWRARASQPNAPRGDGSSTPRQGDVELLAVRSDQVELRSGPVRLVLLAPSSTEPAPSPGL
jgi:hypothetical protein